MSLDQLNSRERTDFVMLLLIGHGKITWECEACDAMTNSLLLAGIHMKEDHPELVEKAKQYYERYMM